jgi:hypothetical protein
MAIVVIGGHSRNVGKTSVVAGIIAALPAYDWTAFKITQFGHGRCSLNGKACQCATSDHSWAMTQEKDRSGKSDSSRFLVAGAARSYWVRTAQGQLAKAIPAIRRRIDEAENAILESNSIVGFLKPDLYISVLDPATEDFKVSAREFLTQADAVMLHDRGKQEAHWQNVVLSMSTPVFAIHPPKYVNAEIIAFVESRLKSTVAALP